MLSAINNLREINRRCRDGEALDPALSFWFAERLDLFLCHEYRSIDDALGLREERGGVPWWLAEAMVARDRALRDLAELVADGRSITARAREVRRRTVSYAGSAWRHDEACEAMPTAYRNKAHEFIWRAFKAGAPMPLGERRLRNILGG